MNAILDYEFAYDEGVKTVGGKAWNMARMARWGFTVPLGFAVSTAVYDEILARKKVAELVAKASEISLAEVAEPKCADLLKTLREAIVKETFAKSYLDELHGVLAVAGLTDAALAIRSSATGEDGEKHAFAGIHESFLNVKGSDEIVVAVLKCFASLWTPQALAYRRRFDFADDDVRGAVLICKMVTAKNANEPIAAGVVFTADPRDGRRDVMVVETTEGMGDKLVNGEVTPTTIRVRLKLDGYEYLDALPDIMPKLMMDELVLNAQRLHWAFSDGEKPQDIEWAYDGERVVMLQVRPVTSLPKCTYDDLKSQPEIWSNGNFKEVLSGILSPLGWSQIPHFSAAHFFDIHHLSGYHEPQGMQIVRRFEGRAYANISIVQYSAWDAWGILPVETNKSFGGFQPEIDVSKSASKGNKNFTLLKILRAVWKGHGYLPQQFADLLIKAQGFLQQDLGELSKQELLALWFALNEEKWQAPYMLANAMGSIWLGIVRQMGVKMLPENELEPLIGGLMSAQGNVVSAQHAYDLHGIVAKYGVEGAGFEAAFEGWMQRYGHRGYNEFDIANPRWRETPDEMKMFAKNMGAALHSPETAQKIREKAEEKLRALPLIKRKMIGWTMDKARDGFALRERGKSTMIAVLGVSRHIILALGSKMSEAGIIERRDDIFYLSFADIQAWAQDAWDGAGAKLLVADRVLQTQNWAAMPSPADVILVGAGMAEPLQAELAIVGNLIEGMGVSPGIAKGLACKLEAPTEVEKLQVGGILVARSTDPSWTPLFLSAAGIVVEIGGYLSHGAIVAREFGLPAVVNAAGCFEAIGDGDELIVDGNVGTVEIGR